MCHGYTGDEKASVGENPVDKKQGGIPAAKGR